MGILRKKVNGATNMNECENQNSIFCTIVVRNVHLDQTHYVNDIDTSTHFHSLLITYCRSHRMDVTRFVFLVPSNEFFTSKIIWKVATPSMRIKDVILESLFDVTERKVYIQCVPKMDVPKYVIWNNCDSTKYTKIVNNAVKDVTYPPAPTLRKKKQAPPPPPVPLRRRPRRNTSKESQLLHQDTSTNDDYLDQTITKSITEISDINSSGSLNDAQELSSALSTINIHAMEEYQDDSSTSEHFFIPKSFIKPDKEDHDEDALSAEFRTTTESSSAVSINGTIQQKVDFDSFKEDIPSVRATAENTATKSNQNSGISPVLKTSPPTFAPFHVPNFEKQSLEMRSSKTPKDGSTAKKVDEGLQQAKAALKTVRQQKVASVPLRNADVEHRPSFLSNRDRANEKDWNGRFWCVENRSRVLSFMIADERQC